MVFGNPKWFGRRKYSGWGLSIKSWKGLIYILILIIPLMVFQFILYWSFQTRLITTGIWMLFLLIEIVDIMRRIDKDEREKIHEAIAERNALWGVMTILVLAILYQTITSALNQNLFVNWWIVSALLVGVVIKAASNYYLDRKN